MVQPPLLSMSKETDLSFYRLSYYYILGLQNITMTSRLLLFLLISALLLSACQTPAQASMIDQHAPDFTALPVDLALNPKASTPPTATSTVITPSSSPSLSPTDPLPTLTPSPTASPTDQVETQLLFTGVIVPARCVQAAIDEKKNPDYPYEEVSEIIQGADLAVGTLNATISDYPPRTGCRPTYVLVGGADNADALARAGFDVMSVATNHIKNCGLTTCGDRAFFDTLDNLRRVGIQPVGAGKDHAEAMQPVVVTLNGIRFGIVSLGQIEPMAFAGPDTPGIAILNQENLKTAIAIASEVSDVVIVMPHWGPEDMAVPNWIQRNLAQDLVAAGADIVVGNHTHVIQAIQEIDGVPVFYGLGNFVFDQGLRDHRQGVILSIRFKGKDYAGYELIPTHVDPDGRVHIAPPEEASEILDRIKEISQAIE
jgi:poly-gamma-glutamate synthesis protein (capsule biosynthesis protein)